jgi:hypothetical protein
VTSLAAAPEQPHPTPPLPTAPAVSTGTAPPTTVRRRPRLGEELLDIAVGGPRLLAAVLTAPVARKRYNSWGAHPDEVAAPLPGDDLVPVPRLGYTRAITIEAPPGDVWQWLVQIGQGRGGFYSYDGLENLVGGHIHSADEILAEHQVLSPGDVIRLAPGDAPEFRVHQVDPPTTLVLVSHGPGQNAARRPGPVVTWQWVLRPLDSGRRTRLLVRQRLSCPRSQRALWYLLEPITFVMERRMLLRLRSRAE